MEHKYSAGIVLYNPDINRLKDNIDSIYLQVQTIYCYNNNSSNLNEINGLLKQYNNVVLINSEKNDGIAKAFNTIAEYAVKQQFKWLLMLDQDSVCPNNLIQNFELYTGDDTVGIICPLIIDKRRPAKEKPKEEVSEIDVCITSGSFVNLEIFNKVGKLDEYLFIGLVDDEYCYRIRKRNYKIICINNVVLDHELGKIYKRKYGNIYIKIGSLLHNEKIKSISYKREVSPLRVYYATRNILYLSKKYKKDSMNKFTVKFAITNGISSVIRGKHKIELIKAFNRGIMDGMKI